MTDYMWETIIGYLEILLYFINSNRVGWITCGVLSATLFVVIFYTYSTYKLQQTAEKQTKVLLKQTEVLLRQTGLSILPSLQLSIDKNSDGDKFFALHNIGNGVALNIAIVIVFYSEDFKKNIQNSTDFVSFLHEKCREQVLSGIPVAAFPAYYKNHRTTFIFSDIEGNKYEQKNKVMGHTSKHGFVKLLSRKETDKT